VPLEKTLRVWDQKRFTKNREGGRRSLLKGGCGGKMLFLAMAMIEKIYEKYRGQ